MAAGQLETQIIAINGSDFSANQQPWTNWSEMTSYAIALPPAVVATAFDYFARPVVVRIIADVHESHTLSALRDILLLRLISGELQLVRAGFPVREAAT